MRPLTDEERRAIDLLLKKEIMKRRAEGYSDRGPMSNVLFRLLRNLDRMQVPAK